MVNGYGSHDKIGRVYRRWLRSNQAALPDEVYFKLRWIQSEVSEIFYSVHITVLGQRIELEL